jgi:hypothetical protein
VEAALTDGAVPQPAERLALWEQPLESQAQQAFPLREPLPAVVLLAPEPLLLESKAEEEEASVWPPEAQLRRVWQPQGAQRAEPEPLPLPSFA